MKLIEIGVLVNTHGIKGEVRIISNFEFKEKVFVIGNELYFSENESLTINSYRKHKNYDMVTFKGINDILEVNKYKGKKVYFDYESLELNENEYLDSQIIGLDAYYENKFIGKIDDIEQNRKQKLFVINNILIPYNENFIDKINIKENKITLKNLNGLI